MLIALQFLETPVELKEHVLRHFLGRGAVPQEMVGDTEMDIDADGDVEIDEDTDIEPDTEAGLDAEPDKEVDAVIEVETEIEPLGEAVTEIEAVTEEVSNSCRDLFTGICDSSEPRAMVPQTCHADLYKAPSVFR